MQTSQELQAVTLLYNQPLKAVSLCADSRSLLCYVSPYKACHYQIANKEHYLERQYQHCPLSTPPLKLNST